MKDANPVLNSRSTYSNSQRRGELAQEVVFGRWPLQF